MTTHLHAALVFGQTNCVGVSRQVLKAIHCTNELFSTHQDQDSRLDVLFVDAATAFNFWNYTVMLLHANVLWPWCSRFLFNTNRNGWCWC